MFGRVLEYECWCWCWCRLWALALGFIQYSVYTQITNEVYDDAASGAYFTALAIAMGFQTMGPLGIFYGPLLLSSFVGLSSPFRVSLCAALS